MRVLASTTAGAGHFGPMVPFLRALADAGHEVAVAAPASFAGSVSGAGFAHEPFADADPAALGAVFAGLQGVTNDEGNAIVVREVFGRLDAQAALPDVTRIVERRRPDLVLREPSEFASHVAAELAGVPTAQIACGLAAFDEQVLPVLEQPLAELGSTVGTAGLLATPRLTLVPASFEDPRTTGAAPTTRYRDPGGQAVSGELPDWWPTSSDPLVYVTFGSVAATLGLFPDLYRAVVMMVADLPIRVLMTLGEAGDPDALAPLPQAVHVEQWWPQQQVMPHAAAMVGHGGFGTTLLGLASGTPMVCVPLFADQPFNARRVDAVGAGIAVGAGVAGGPVPDSIEAALGDLPQALERVLTDQSFAQRAAAIAEEIAGLPEASAAVPLLESLAR